MTALRAAALAMCAAGGLSAAGLTFEQWRADLDYLGRELPRRHRNLFHTLSRGEFERRLKELSSAVPKLSDLEVRAGIARLVAAAADGHTGAELAAERVFDFSFLEFADGLYVIGASKVNAEAVGARVISIDGMPTLEVRRRLGEFLAMENQYSAAQYVALIPKTVYMRAAGIIHSTDGAEFVLEKDGRTFSVRAATRGAKDPPAERAKSMAARPLYLKHADQFYWWEYLADSKTLYIQYNSCESRKDLSFQEFTRQIVEQAGREAPNKIVIDLRDNGGGNSEISNPLIEAMRSNPSLKPPGGVSVLTGLGTYSSGLMVALSFREQFQALVAGEPTAERPNHYGNLRSLRLPNSGMTVSYSTRYFAALEDNPPTLMPELRIAPSAADYFGGRDPVMDAVLKLPGTIEESFRAVIAKEPGNARAYIALAKIDRSRAEAILKDGIAASPQSAALRLELAGYYGDKKQYALARDLLSAGPETDASILCRMGRLYLQERNFARAEDAFLKCHRLEPDSLHGLQGAVDVLAAQNKMDSAWRLLDEEAAKDSGGREVRIFAGRLAAGAGRLDVAAAQYERAIAETGAQSPDAFEMWMELSEIYRKKGDARGAIRAFRKDMDVVDEMVKTMPVGPGMLLGYVRGFYEQAQRREPNDGVLLNNLSAVLAKMGTNLDRAAAMAEQARQALPEILDVMDNLGYVYLKQKRTEQALEALRDAANREPGNSRYRLHFAMALEASGNREGAILELEAALKASDDARDQVEEMLRKLAPPSR